MWGDFQKCTCKAGVLPASSGLACPRPGHPRWCIPNSHHSNDGSNDGGDDGDDDGSDDSGDDGGGDDGDDDD